MAVTLIKIAFVVGTAYWWLPFFRALLAEINEGLAEEGGLLGGWKRPRRGHVPAAGLVHRKRFDHRYEGVSTRARGLAARPRTRALRR